MQLPHSFTNFMRQYHVNNSDLQWYKSMKARIKFSKFGTQKFIGHLDVMRYFQKAIRRAELDVVYSNGFNPHQIMSFASPLGVGLTSDGEYVDIELHSTDIESVMINRLNNQMAEGFLVTGFLLLPDPKLNQRKETAMSLVAAADYLISLKDGYSIMYKGSILSKTQIEQLFQEFMKKESIQIVKKSKKTEKDMDIKPYIYGYGFHGDEFYNSLHLKPECLNSHEEKYENNTVIYLQVAAGSVTNIKPELVLEAFFQYLGIEVQPFAFQIHRIEMYSDQSRRGMTQLMLEEAIRLGTLPKRDLVSLIHTNI